MNLVIPTRLPEYFIAAVAIILAPGPSVLFTIARAIAWGRKVAVLTVIGNATGFLVLSILVAVGIGPLIQKSAIAYAVVQWGGGIYLIYLGVDALRKRAEHSNQMLEQGNAAAPTSLRTIRDGFVVGVLNPKGIVFCAAVMPQFIDRDRGSVVFQLILLGVIFSLLALICDGTWGLLAGTARIWLATDLRRIVFLRTAGGLVMIILGVLVLFSAWHNQL